MKKIKNHCGEKYGRLTVINFVERKNRQSYWKCICDCGNEIVIPISYLIVGDTKSCGYLRKENARKNGKKNKFVQNKRLYRIWIDMKRRCYSTKRISYKYYGQKGICICDEWKNSFKAFQDWALNNGYEDTLSIDRINNNGNYEPSNCRWATIKQQNNNMSTNHYIEYNNEKYTLKQLCEKYNFDYDLTRNRLKYGWTLEKAITTPKRRIQKK